MSKKPITKALIAIIVASLLSLPARATAQETNAGGSPNLSSRAFQNALEETVRKKFKRGAYFLLGIEEKLNRQKDELNLLKDNTKALETKIEESKTDGLKLESQLENITKLVTLNREKVRVAKLQIASYENKIAQLKLSVRDHQRDVQQNVSDLDEIISTYYLQTNLFFDPVREDPSLLAYIAHSQSVGDVLKQNEYLHTLTQLSQDVAAKILIEQMKLDEREDELNQKIAKLSALQLLVTREQKILEEAQQSKERLLEETQGKQALYEALLELSRKEIEQVSQQIRRLQENYLFFQTKLDELRDNPDAYELPISDREELALASNETAPLAWPVSPSLGLSAHYKDSAYQKALGVVHHGIDIRVSQGSKVKSAADGVVTKVADNGFGYSYIIVAHADKLLTLYGHLSDMLVSEGEIVRQGQTIGFSGGIPGTKGAGWLTTGAHLHLEVFRNFSRVDPLDYLPIEYVPVSTLPERHLKKLMERAQ